MGDELGLQVQDLIVAAGDQSLELYPDLSVPPLPVADPFAAFGWFFDPAIPHWDFWWWYLYYAGLEPGQAGLLAVPFLLAALGTLIASGVLLARVLRRPRSRAIRPIKPSAKM
jgi:hypothetical protein